MRQKSLSLIDTKFNNLGKQLLSHLNFFVHYKLATNFTNTNKILLSRWLVNRPLKTIIDKYTLLACVKLHQSSRCQSFQTEFFRYFYFTGKEYDVMYSGSFPVLLPCYNLCHSSQPKKTCWLK